MSSDAELILMARAGDESALEVLLTRYREFLRVRSARELDSDVKPRIDASDVTQATLLEIHKGFQDFRGSTEREWKSWIRKILDRNIQNSIRDHKMTQKRSVERQKHLDVDRESGKIRRENLTSAEAPPSQNAIREEDTMRLESLLDSLPEAQRIAVRMRHAEGRTLEEIARALGRSKDAAAGLIKRGMQSLREQLSKRT